MKNILLILSLIFFVSSTSFAAQFGKGKIDIDSSFKDGYQGYLQELQEDPSWVGVFAADNDGGWGWSMASGGQSWQRATTGALKNCNKYSDNNSCRIFAKGSRIFWKWEDLPNLSYDSSKHVDPSSINVSIGSGEVYPNYDVKKEFKNYQDTCKPNKNDPQRIFICFFAISKNGTKSGYTVFSTTPGDGKTLNKIIREEKAKAVANCMENNNKKPCYLYANQDEVIWKQETVSVDTTKDEVVDDNDLKKKLKKLKELYEEGLIDKDIFEEKRSEILDSI